MSWLLVAFIPVLLMLATFGLERLESRLNPDAVHPSDVAEFLERAQPRDVSTLARDGMPEALDCFHRRRTRAAANHPAVASRDYGQGRVNPQFLATRQADSV
ncbi:MAG: hypothetical protein JO044_09675 [Mycobacteriaceae bacterium]|nr:hypothetical protein [Mycobacteriaceae bacterium]MBV9638537.1 hypothetical protein [Mycobacteriaceae bacterium]